MCQGHSSGFRHKGRKRLGNQKKVSRRDGRSLRAIRVEVKTEEESGCYVKGAVTRILEVEDRAAMVLN